MCSYVTDPLESSPSNFLHCHSSSLSPFTHYRHNITSHPAGPFIAHNTHRPYHHSELYTNNKSDIICNRSRKKDCSIISLWCWDFGQCVELLRAVALTGFCQRCKMSACGRKRKFTLPLLFFILLKLTSAQPDVNGQNRFKDTGTHIPPRMSPRGRSKVNHVSPSVIWSSLPPMATKNIGEDGSNMAGTEDRVASEPPGTPAGIVPYKGMLLRTADCPDSDMEAPVKVFDIFADMWQLIALAAMVCLAVSLIVTFVLCLLLFRMRVTKELEKDLQDRQPIKPDLGDTSSYVSFTSPDEDMRDDHPIKIVIQDTELDEQEQRNEPRPDMSTFKIRKMTPV